MKRFLIPLFILLLSFPAGNAKGQDTLLLFHPTAGNLEVIQRLLDKQILNLDGIHILGVYHERETYDYSGADSYMDDHPGLPVSLLEIKDSLAPGHLFQENECTRVFARLFQGSVGALFMGGPDIPPVLYNEQVHLLTVVTDPFRHYLEASYLFHLLGGYQDPKWKPWMEENGEYLISGICLGMQTLNVATGGTLVQDIPSEIYHIWHVEELLALPTEQVHLNYEGMLHGDCEAPTSYHFHPIHLTNGSFLFSGEGKETADHPLVLSAHHQCVGSIGKELSVAATSMDGRVIEALQHTRFPHVFGVQFHPEKPGLFDQAMLHSTGCGTTASFYETIADTRSYDFHLAYWGHLNTILQSVKRGR